VAYLPLCPGQVQVHVDLTVLPHSSVVVLEEILVLEDPRGPIFKSSSLSSSLSLNFQLLDNNTDTWHQGQGRLSALHMLGELSGEFPASETWASSQLYVNGITICGMMMWYGQPYNHTFHLLSKHDISPCSATCMNARWNRCQDDLNSSPLNGDLEESTQTPSYYMDEDYPARPETQ